MKLLRVQTNEGTDGAAAILGARLDDDVEVAGDALHSQVQGGDAADCDELNPGLIEARDGM